MNPLLDNVNNLYLQLESYFDPSLDLFLSLSEEKRIEYMVRKNELTNEYKTAIEMMRTTITILSEQEILEGYQEGCKLLQRSLSGYMCQNYDPIYAQAMVNAIERDESHVAPHFLQTLANNLGREIIPIAIYALNSNVTSIKRTALSVADQLLIVEALDKIQELTNDGNEEIPYLAKEVVRRLEKN